MPSCRVREPPVLGGKDKLMSVLVLCWESLCSARPAQPYPRKRKGEGMIGARGNGGKGRKRWGEREALHLGLVLSPPSPIPR